MKLSLFVTLVALALLSGGAHAGPAAVNRLAATSEADLFKQGLEQTSLKAYAEASKTFSEVLKLNPKNLDALSYRAHCYVVLANYAAALADYERMLTLGPAGYNKVRVLIGRGEVYRQQNKLDLALADFEQAIHTVSGLNLDPMSKSGYLDEARFGRAQIYAAQGKTELARADFKLITANLILRRQEYVDAYSRFEAKIRQEAEAQVKLAMQKGEQQDFNGAKAALDECIRLEPRAQSCYVYRAQVQIRLGAPEPALQDLNSAIELNRKEPQVYYLRALVYANTGKQELAIADLRQALKLKPDFKEAADGLRQMGVTP
ncbi:MAG: tetratricopeptide repeat protein [Candidatus Sericytochromatia bacterium]